MDELTEHVIGVGDLLRFPSGSTERGVIALVIRVPSQVPDGVVLFCSRELGSCRVSESFGYRAAPSSMIIGTGDDT